MSRDVRELGGAWTRSQRHAFDAPDADLAPWVDRFWTVRWDYQEPYRQKIVPYPQAHLTVRPGVAAAEVHGPPSRHVVKELAGNGSVVGVAFRPGVFRALLGRPVHELTDRWRPARDLPVFGSRPEDPADAAEMADWLRAVLPPAPDPTGRDAAALVERVASDRTITRVDELAAVAGTGVRGLQRLFREHVGLGPKWVIRRYRLHEVTERLATGATIRWADLAGELGYADQSHLSRDFTALFGEPPGWYARRY
ncbi:helix-turn-helix domain-containing protein [Pseudonocardia endophytica]|uniref:AraC-like DNA-binding protein n=1 Tax=Pseudonocardia endophytica TaxID=401976 RepID=A0A4R1HTL3_PSEEN|nr:helix-turn-helix domain-containing protein [Pseudonocardia endophytica]TCK24721.1 AraC-like DNA-binding protein [Pseudonocardia endophytica]